MKLSIIIVSYNTKTILDDCLSSIYSSQIQDPYEIIIVDNHSQDGTIEMLECKYPQAILIKNQTNNLFAKANNQGAEIAQGEYLLLLNSDTIVYDNNIQKMIDYFDTLGKEVICIGPKVLNKDRSVQSEGFPNSSIMERITMCFKLYKFLPSFLLPMGAPCKGNHARPVGWVVGACMMMRKDYYLKVGGLNENVEFYGEEPEFGYRTHRLGYKTIYYPSAEIIHLGGSSTDKTKSADPEIIIKRQNTALRRYSLLQKETVGYRKAIWMSRVVLFAAYMKLVVSSNKVYYKQAIVWEKEVIKYLKSKLNETTAH